MSKHKIAYIGWILAVVAINYLIYTVIGRISWIAIGVSILFLAFAFIGMRETEKGEKRKQQQKADMHINDEDFEKKLSEAFGDEKFNMQLVQKTAIDRAASESMAALTNALRSSGAQTKESNWAIAGGIASGFAGPIAGAAVAADTIINNAKIREENERNRQYVNKAADEATAEFRNALQGSTTWVNDISALYRKHSKTITWSIEGLFRQLEIKTVMVNVDSASGVKVEAAWKNKEKDSWIDGSIRGKLYGKDTGKLAGCVYLNLPLGGTMSEGCTVLDVRLIGHCTHPKYRESSYEVKYEPINLWRLVPATAESSVGDGTTAEEHKKEAQKLLNSYHSELSY